jgi:hypothetical protein
VAPEESNAVGRKWIKIFKHNVSNPSSVQDLFSSLEHCQLRPLNINLRNIEALTLIEKTVQSLELNSMFSAHERPARGQSSYRCATLICLKALWLNQVHFRVICPYRFVNQNDSGSVSRSFTIPIHLHIRRQTQKYQWVRLESINPSRWTDSNRHQTSHVADIGTDI